MSVPGIGPVTAMTLPAFAPPAEGFRRGRDFPACLGLVPLQYSTGGKPRLGRTPKMGQRDIRRLLILGAMSVISDAKRSGTAADPRALRMLQRRPVRSVATAPANRLARVARALMVKQEAYRAPAA